MNYAQWLEKEYLPERLERHKTLIKNWNEIHDIKERVILTMYWKKEEEITLSEAYMECNTAVIDVSLSGTIALKGILYRDGSGSYVSVGDSWWLSYPLPVNFRKGKN